MSGLCQIKEEVVKHHYQYLIVGGGMTGDAATRGIRELDENGSIGMISEEPDPPYSRPNLSKGLWKGRPMEKVWRKTQERNVKLHLERKVTHLDPAKKSLRDHRGDVYTYDKLLLATGGSPIRLPFGGDDIIYYRYLQDYLRLRELTEEGERFLVIGGSFIGSEIAAALTMVGKQVVMVLRDAIGGSVFPKDLASFLNDYYREKGVEVVTGDSVAGIERNGSRYNVRTEVGRNFEVDGIVAGIGIRPNLDLAQEAGLKVEDGIIVNERLETSAPDIYAAGDVANFYHPALEERTRVEHEDNALQMGVLAGHNMVGADEKYTNIPMFYSDLFELGYEAVGELNSELETVSDWQEPFQKGVVYYLDNDRLRGVLLWNFWKQVDNARALLMEKKQFKAKELLGKLK
jgi:3-phenylpropionate/trans-cinnamate dioxygenase ferredoxin reductase subunit